MSGAAELAAGRTARDILRLDRYLQDAVALVGADGSPLIQGRSLIYRFAAAAPFWAGILAEVPSTSPGLLRHAATRIVAHFADNGVPDADGVLSLGWHHEWTALAQSYSGPGSPYWAAKGLLGIALPADHPVWSASPEPLPVETADQLRVIAAPGWIVSATRDDGIVRVLNHGTDHGIEGSRERRLTALRAARLLDGDESAPRRGIVGRSARPVGRAPRRPRVARPTARA